jgi:hypothetical protein
LKAVVPAMPSQTKNPLERGARPLPNLLANLFASDAIDWAAPSSSSTEIALIILCHSQGWEHGWEPSKTRVLRDDAAEQWPGGRASRKRASQYEPLKTNRRANEEETSQRPDQPST